MAKARRLAARNQFTEAAVRADHRQRASRNRSGLERRLGLPLDPHAARWWKVDVLPPAENLPQLRRRARLG
jgi:hypothetical protein